MIHQFVPEKGCWELPIHKVTNKKFEVEHIADFYQVVFAAENEKNYFPFFLVTWVVFGKIFVRLSSSSLLLLLLLIMSSYFWIIITSCSLKYMEREWKAYVDEYTSSEILLSNCIAAAAFLTYCGAMGVDRR